MSKLPIYTEKLKNNRQQQACGLCDDHIVYINQGIGIHRDMQAAFLQMQQDAALDDIDLQIASGFRDFTRQLHIFNGKLSGQRSVKDLDNNVVDIQQLMPEQALYAILLYSALPGGSRHHWGCDIDVFDANALNTNTLALEPWEYQQGGPMHKLYQWLCKHANRYGFYHPYQYYQGGVAAEPWHLSYQPLAKLYEDALDLDTLRQTISQADICEKQLILNNLAHIYQQYICNTCAFGDNTWPPG
ncbi:M15 family metallopeptidase [Thalassotalea maritima]|uniref:M15 family metallopeptidase n=1 Tax=Thalassotalea maritima TaxID=3242416 RepID=UPI003527CC3F